MSLSKTFEMAFVVGASLQANFAQTMDKAQKSTSLLERTVKKLNRANENIKSVLARRNATQAAYHKLGRKPVLKPRA